MNTLFLEITIIKYYYEKYYINYYLFIKNCNAFIKAIKLKI